MMKPSTLSRLIVALCIAAAGAMLGGCDFLNVDNPNNLIEEDLDDPAAAGPIANGAEASLTRAMIDMVGPYSLAGDEVVWIGSRNSWEQIDQGDLNDPLNEYNNRIYEFVAEARWTTDEYIRRLEDFRAAGALASNRPLIRTYLYGAIARVAIADMYDNFVFSNRREAGEPIGEENMGQLYDTAIEYINDALDLSPADDLRQVLLALRARAKYSKGLWAKLNPAGQVNTSDPLVNDSDAAADAAAALALMEAGADADYRYQLILDPSLADLVPFDQALADHLNERRELDFSGQIGERIDDETFNVTLQDPIDNVPQPFLQEQVNDFIASDEYADFTVVSAREMHLIQAEVALAQTDTDGFEDHINAIRTMDGLTSYDGQIPAVDMLEHARRVHLFLQGRRLADQYRFQSPSPEWTSQSVAATTPGTFFPIPDVERQSNPNL